MKVHILCGIPGSGKSTLGKDLLGYIVSTDAIRKFLWDDESFVKYDKLVFNLAYNIIEYMLSKNENIIFDATNATVKRRQKIIKVAKSHNAEVIVHWINCPIEVAIKRNYERQRKVPTKIIKSIHKAFRTPSLKEGIDEINIYDQSLKLYKTITE